MKLCLLSFAFLCALLAGCVKDPAPDEIVSAYFEKAADGDIFALREFLTPDGQETLDEFASMKPICEELEKNRPVQREFWSDIQRSVSAPKYSGNRAEVVFTAICNGKHVALPIVLHRINGAWKISSHSFQGPRVTQFQMDLMNAKKAGSPDDTPKQDTPAATPAPANSK